MTFAHSARHCAQQAHVLAITTPWEEFKSISPEDLNASLGQPTMVDCWRLLPRRKFESVVHYVTLGSGLQKAKGEPGARQAPVTRGLTSDYAAAGK